MKTKPRKLWKRSRKTTLIVNQIREAIKKFGYDEEIATTPLADVYSVLVRKDDEMFNVRLDKNSLQIVETDQLQYSRKKDQIRQVFRRQV